MTLVSKADGKYGLNMLDQGVLGGIEVVVNEYLRRIVEDNPSIHEIIIAEDNKDMHDDPYLDLDTVVAKFTKRVHYFWTFAQIRLRSTAKGPRMVRRMTRGPESSLLSRQ
jgi:hypothetical protein